MSPSARRRQAVPIWSVSDSPAVLVEVLARGGVLAVPTGSSYALGADPSSAIGVQTVYEIKKRNAGKPLPVVIAAERQLSALGVELTGPARHLAEELWPGPLSIVLPCADSLPAAAGRGRLAVRLPGYAPLRELLSAVGPLTATSANRAGEPPVLVPAHLTSLLAGYDAVIVDGGELPGGAPSTVVALDGEVLQVLRRGRLPVARLRRLVPSTEVHDPHAIRQRG